MQKGRKMNNERKVEIVTTTEGKPIVVIWDIVFKNRQCIDWDEVEAYLYRFAEEQCIIDQYSEKVYIGSEFPKEYAGSEYTRHLKGTLAKAKANAAQGIPELIKIAKNRKYDPNHKKKHSIRAKYGWYRYDSRFAIPVYDTDGEIERFNVFRVRMIVNHAAYGKKYLYDMINIKKEKETGNPLKN
jgi:hypothetical protein